MSEKNLGRKSVCWVLVFGFCSYIKVCIWGNGSKPHCFGNLPPSTKLSYRTSAKSLVLVAFCLGNAHFYLTGE